MAGMLNGDPGSDLAEPAVQVAALELVHAAGRPELLIAELSEYEREAWRVAARRTIRAYVKAQLVDR